MQTIKTETMSLKEIAKKMGRDLSRAHEKLTRGLDLHRKRQVMAILNKECRTNERRRYHIF
jgi:hypothetical protein